MGLFDFFRFRKTEKQSINLEDFKFLSDNHIRIENGQPTNANNKGAWRGIRVKTSDNKTFFVTMYNMNGNHPVWGTNIQMSEKRMKIIDENNNQIIFRGFGIDAMGSSFSDYGLTLYKSKNIVNKVTLHMHDRNIEIVYLKAEDKIQVENLNQYSDFDNFKSFTDKWNTSMPMQEKMQIATQSDDINNRGTAAYRNDDYSTAIKYFEQALSIMPNNDDALKNLKIGYKRIGDYQKIIEIERKLIYLQ